MMTDYTDPTTIDVDEVRANINHDYRMRSHRWDDRLSWPNVTVKALADRIEELERENARLHKLAYLTVPVPRIFRRRTA